MVLVTSFVMFSDYCFVFFLRRKLCHAIVPEAFFVVVLECWFFGSLVENCYIWAEVCFSWEVWRMKNQL